MKLKLNNLGISINNFEENSSNEFVVFNESINVLTKGLNTLISFKNGITELNILLTRLILLIPVKSILNLLKIKSITELKITDNSLCPKILSRIWLKNF
ncbi:hypothetical protein NW731_06615 [Mycoplasmopsis felis]|uniref:hypothetical protein n=1 Tax=Mycoplasmopsis felis TaxID=33923 RepID=UPI0021E038E5|nr:hypothetical protein [Mycoplasmopsis felis]MCU9938032.1 hypothetical protein [Mycoplasmopsis felis]